MRPDLHPAAALLLEAFQTGLAEIAPKTVVPAALPEPPRGRTVVVGAGKASAAMAQAVEADWTGSLTGLVVVPYGYSRECRTIEVIEAAHPVPDEAGMSAATRMLDMVSQLGSDDLVVALFSGGGSALLPLPGGRLSIADKRSLTVQLLQAGATIGEINTVRKHLSAIKGGRLARAAAPARLVNILISDVAGDDPATIASGPAVPDPTTLADARSVIDKYDLQVSDAIRHHLADPANETPGPDDPCFARVTTHIVSSGRLLLAAAARALQSHGFAVVDLGDAVEGDSAFVAHDHADLARALAATGCPVAPPCVILSGGETTVTVRGPGKGGPNMEYLLALLCDLQETPAYAALACDSDGSDGSTEAAGALVTSDSWQKARARGLDPTDVLRRNDSHTFFAELGDLVITGPTFNNVNDFRALLLPGDT